MLFKACRTENAVWNYESRFIDTDVSKWEHFLLLAVGMMATTALRVTSQIAHHIKIEMLQWKKKLFATQLQLELHYKSLLFKFPFRKSRVLLFEIYTWVH